MPQPVLVVEGYAGSGRTTLLESACPQWVGITPTVLLNARALDHPDDMQSLLTAIMLGLARKVPGYNVSFPRSVLAQIAMMDGIARMDWATGVAELEHRIEAYRSPTALAGFIQNLVDAQAAAVPDASTAVSRVAEGLTGKAGLGRWLKRFAWNRSALSWFGHQDRGLRVNPMGVLVRLGAQAATDNSMVRREVNSLLVAALVADLRDSLDSLTRRPANAVVMIDDADTPSAVSFTRSLLEVRREAASGAPAEGLPDPLTLITTSDGTLAEVLDRRFPRLAGIGGARSDDVWVSGMWFWARMADLSSDDVLYLASGRDWPADIGARLVAWVVYRLTHGHPEATTMVLEKLGSEPLLIDHMDDLLGLPGPEPGIPIDRYLLRRAVASLNRRHRPGGAMLEALVTVSAARNLKEALTLAPLLSEGTDSVLLASTTLWSPERPEALRHLHPLIRYLGLRALDE